LIRCYKDKKKTVSLLTTTFFSFLYNKHMVAVFNLPHGAARRWCN